MPTSLIATGRFIGIYPLKQFAPVIHENHRISAASQWAKSPPNQLDRETQEQPQRQAMEWLEGMEVRRVACADLIIRLEDVINY